MEKFEELKKAFAEYEKAHKSSVRLGYMTIVTGMVAVSCCFVSGVINAARGHWYVVAIMFVLFWFNFYMMVQGIVLSELEKRDFRSLKVKHEAFVEHMESLAEEDN